jgi:acetylornithine deacetylase/succinyl-diaminopimelate desuccinylase-like protein
MSKTSTTATLEKALAHARAHKDADLADLMEELRIPSVSALKRHRPDCIRNAEWLVARFERMGFKAKVVNEPKDALPLVVAEWDGAPGKPHLTIYGHYDVQPADPADKWETPAFEPNVRNGNLFARGASDNKGDHMTAIKAVEHLAASGDLPLNIRFLIEGEEESSSYTLPPFLRDHAEELGTDAVLVWDGGFDELGRPVMCTALRGILYVEIQASGRRPALRHVRRQRTEPAQHLEPRDRPAERPQWPRHNSRLLRRREAAHRGGAGRVESRRRQVPARGVAAHRLARARGRAGLPRLGA